MITLSLTHLKGGKREGRERDWAVRKDREEVREGREKGRGKMAQIRDLVWHRNL